MHFERVLVTSDFSEDSYSAFEFAAYQAKMEGTEVTLLSVVTDWEVPPALLRQIPHPERIENYRKEILEHAETELRALVANRFHGQKVAIKAILAKKGVADEICDFAKAARINLIVMASHGRGAVGNLLLGSVVSKVIRRAHCPVLVVPRDGK